MKLTKKMRDEALANLDSIIRMANVLKNVPDDFSNWTYREIEWAKDNLDEACASVLKNQKKRGKQFVSDEDIDRIIEEVKQELQ